jgi:hypothetical protein
MGSCDVTTTNGICYRWRYTKLIAVIRSLHPNFSHILCIRHVCKNLSYLSMESEFFVPIPEALNMRLQGQRLTESVNTKWEEMIRDWRAVILKEQQCSYQQPVENERKVTQHRHRGMLFASVNGFISQFVVDKVQEHMALFNLTARSSLPACSGTFAKSIGLPCAHII